MRKALGVGRWAQGVQRMALAGGVICSLGILASVITASATFAYRSIYFAIVFAAVCGLCGGLRKNQ